MSSTLPPAASEASARFYNRIAPDYDRQLDVPGDAWVREAFHQFVAARASPSSTLLDFGCGTGTDAAWYLQRGHQVLAYDNSPGMVAQLQQGRGLGSPAGRLDAWSCPYSEFGSSMIDRPRPEVVTANFAVVNLLPSLDGWFELLRPLLAPGARVLASSLNPCHSRDLGRPAFWRQILSSGDRTGLRQSGQEHDHLRYWPWSLHRSPPGFRFVSSAGVGGVIRYGRGPRNWHRPHSAGERLEHLTWQRWPGWLLGKFSFVEYQRWD